MRGFWAAACLLLASMQVYAGVIDSGTGTRLQQRELYREAIQAIQNGNIGKANRLATRLTDYPLYPYIEYTEKIYNLPRESAAAIVSFRDRYKNQPIADQLMENWVYVLAKQNRWTEFLEYYDPATFTGQRDACFYAYALYREGHKQAAFDAARKLWLVNFSQPDECDLIFRVWRESGQFDARAAWRRYAMSMEAGDISLANYLKRFLIRKDRWIADEFSRVRRHPTFIERYGRFKRDDKRTNQLILYGVNRLALIEPDAAYAALRRYAGSHSFDASALMNAYSQIGVQMALHGDKGNLLDQLPVNLQNDAALTEARIRLALRQLDWSEALILMNVLPPADQASSRWQFWKARVLARSADAADRQYAMSLYQRLSQDRSFYGFLSADAIGAPYHFQDTAIAVSPETITKVQNQPGIQRALELFTLNELIRARREWYWALRGFDRQQLEAAACVAQKWGWYRQAIKAMIGAGAWNDLDIRFPFAYYDTFVTNAQASDIPLQWSLAVARQESAFMPDARSSAGAMGIMQILPRTARLTAKRQGLVFHGSDELNQPIANIRIGSAYLGQLLREFNDNRVIASAAYNAGPARVAAWINPTLPADVWIETLPYPETRNYVENVLMFSVIYSHRMSQAHPLIYAHELEDFSNQEVTLNVPARDHAAQDSDAGTD